MPDDVKIEVTGDVKKAEAAFDKLNSMVAKQGAQIDKLQSKTKQATDSGATGFQNMSNEIGAMATRAVGLTAIIAGVYKTFSATVDKMKEIRDTTDSAKISTDESLRKVYKQFELKTSGQQAQMRNAIFGASQSRGMKISDVASDYLEQGLNGRTAEELYTQKYNQGLDLKKATGLKDNSGQDMIKAWTMKRGIKDATPEQLQEAAEGLAELKSEVGEFALFAASLMKTKKGKLIDPDAMAVLWDMNKDARAGKEKQTASSLVSAVEKGGLNEAIKGTGYDKAEFAKRLDKQKNNRSALKNSLGIEDESVQTEINRAQNKKDIVYSQEVGPLEQTLKSNIDTEDQANKASLTDRLANDAAVRMFGADKASSYAPTEANLRMLFSGFVEDLRGWSASLSAETSIRSINTNEDKDKVHVKINK